MPTEPTEHGIAMAQYKSEFMQILAARGFIQDVTEPDELDKLLSTETVTGYIGFDATATSLHAGSLIPIMLLYWLQQTGHRPIVLLGGATSKVGDPSFKEEMRQLLDDESIANNIRGIGDTFARVLRVGEGATDVVIVNNEDWLGNVKYLDFLRDYGRHFTMSRMLSMESVKQRLDREQSLTFLEFNYMILQAYDFVELNRKFGCQLQMGGSDQWGNIVNGVDLGRRVDGAQLYGLTTPLLTTSSGKKMGKTEDGAVWLNADRLSPYDYWQYWRNSEDGDVARFLKLYTTMPLDEIARLEALDGSEINEAKKILATEATAIIHGREAADKACATAEETFAGGGHSLDLLTVEIPSGEIKSGLGLLSANVAVGFASSNSDARRLIKGGGMRVNDKQVTDERTVLTNADINTDGVIKLSAGKKRHALIKPV